MANGEEDKPAEEAEPTADKEAQESKTRTETFGSRIKDQLARALFSGEQPGTIDPTYALPGTIDQVLKGSEVYRAHTAAPIKDELQRIPRLSPIPDISLKFTAIQTGLGPDVDRILTQSQKEMAGALASVHNVLRDRVTGVQQSVVIIDRNVRSVDTSLKKFQQSTATSLEDLSSLVKHLSQSQKDSALKFRDLGLGRDAGVTQVAPGLSLTDLLSTKNLALLWGGAGGLAGLSSVAMPLIIGGVGLAILGQEYKEISQKGMLGWLRDNPFSPGDSWWSLLSGDFEKKTTQQVEKQVTEYLAKQAKTPPSEKWPWSMFDLGPGKKSEGQLRLEQWQRDHPNQTPPNEIIAGATIAAGVGGAATAPTTPQKGFDWLQNTDKGPALPDTAMQDITPAAATKVIEDFNLERMNITFDARQDISLTARRKITIKAESVLFDALEIEFKGKVKGLGKEAEEAAAEGGAQASSREAIAAAEEQQKGIIANIEKAMGLAPGTLQGGVSRGPGAKGAGGGIGGAQEPAPSPPQYSAEQQAIQKQLIETGQITESQAKTLYGDKIPEQLQKSLVPGTAEPQFAPKVEAAPPGALAPTTPVIPSAPAVSAPGVLPAIPAPGAAPISPAPSAAPTVPAPGAAPSAPAPGALPAVPAPGAAPSAMERLQEAVKPGGPPAPMAPVPPGALGPEAKPQFVYKVPSKPISEEDVLAKATSKGKYRTPRELKEGDTSRDLINIIGNEAQNNQASIDAVINNMFNRLGSSSYKGDTLEEIAKASNQYESWEFLQSGRFKPVSDDRAQAIEARIRAIATGNEPDPTGGANEFRAASYVRGRGAGGSFARDAASGGREIGGNIYAARAGFTPGTYAASAEPKEALYGPPSPAQLASARTEIEAGQIEERKKIAGLGTPGGAVAATPDATAVAGAGGKGRLEHLRGHLEGVDPRLLEVVGAATQDLPKGYTAKVISGKDARSTGTTNHPGGIAIDLQIYNQEGNLIPYDKNSSGWKEYEKLYRSVHIRGEEMYPKEQFIWGGAWISKAAGRGDPMHYQIKDPSVRGSSQSSGRYSFEHGLAAGHPFLAEGGSLTAEERAQYDVSVREAMTKEKLLPETQQVAKADTAPDLSKQPQPITPVPPAVEKTITEKAKGALQEVAGIKPAGAAEKTPEVTKQGPKIQERISPEGAELVKPKAPAMAEHKIAPHAAAPKKPATPVPKPAPAMAAHKISPHAAAPAPEKPATPTEKPVAAAKVEPKASSGPAHKPPVQKDRGDPQSSPQHSTKQQPAPHRADKATKADHHPASSGPSSGGDRGKGGGGGGQSPDACHFCDA